MTEHYDIAAPTPGDDVIDHQERVEAVIDHEIEKGDAAEDAENLALFVTRGTAVIASPTAPGATYSQAEMASLKTAIDAIRAQLTAHHLTA